MAIKICMGEKTHSSQSSILDQEIVTFRKTCIQGPRLSTPVHKEQNVQAAQLPAPVAISDQMCICQQFSGSACS